MLLLLMELFTSKFKITTPYQSVKTNWHCILRIPLNVTFLNPRMVFLNDSLTSTRNFIYSISMFLSSLSSYNQGNEMNTTVRLTCFQIQIMKTQLLTREPRRVYSILFKMRMKFFFFFSSIFHSFYKVVAVP